MSQNEKHAESLPICRVPVKRIQSRFGIMSAMTSQQIMQDSHMTRMRAIKDENARLREELSRACEERDSLLQHFALALLAARDAEQLPAGGTMLIVDGWNAILGSENVRGKSDTGWREQLKSIVAKLQNKFHVSAAEIDEQDVHQIIVIGVAAIVPHNAMADSLMDEISQFVEDSTEAELLDEQREIR